MLLDVTVICNILVSMRFSSLRARWFEFMHDSLKGNRGSLCLSHAFISCKQFLSIFLHHELKLRYALSLF